MRWHDSVGPGPSQLGLEDWQQVTLTECMRTTSRRLVNARRASDRLRVYADDDSCPLLARGRPFGWRMCPVPVRRERVGTDAGGEQCGSALPARPPRPRRRTDAAAAAWLHAERGGPGAGQGLQPARDLRRQVDGQRPRRQACRQGVEPARLSRRACEGCVGGNCAGRDWRPDGRRRGCAGAVRQLPAGDDSNGEARHRRRGARGQ